MTPITIPALHIPEKTIAIDPDTIRELILAARRAAETAHAPYSNFHVGAALLMADDPDKDTTASSIITGANVENASYGATICAERNAIAIAAARGLRLIQYLAVSVTQTLDRPLAERSPCGICRQTIREFADAQTLVIIDHSDDNSSLGDLLDIDRLLPHAFHSPRLTS